MADGHPDLNGFWNGAVQDPNAKAKAKGPGGFSFVGGVFQRHEDGSVIYDPSTEHNSESGAGRLCLTDDCQAPNQPPYTPEYMEKVKKIAATQFGGTTPLDPVHDCRPLGVPRAGINGIQIVQTPQITAILYESAPYSTFRMIYTDGRSHPRWWSTSPASAMRPGWVGVEQSDARCTPPYTATRCMWSSGGHARETS